MHFLFIDFKKFNKKSGSCAKYGPDPKRVRTGEWSAYNRTDAVRQFYTWVRT